AHAAGTAPEGDSNFPKFVQAVAAFPKPLVCAVNGLAVGIGATVLGYADLVFMSTEARIRTPFTDLCVAPEAGSSFTFPRLLGRQSRGALRLRRAARTGLRHRRREIPGDDERAPKRSGGAQLQRHRAD